MKRSITLLSLVLALIMLPLMAADQYQASTIPFDFVVRGITLPAGEYETQRLVPAGIWMIRSMSDNAKAAFSANLEDYPRNSEPRLVFHRYGKTYFLSQIWTNSLGVTLPESRQELQLRARVGAPVVVAVLMKR